MSICGPFTIVCLSGATCLYVVRSQVHNIWSDMSICGPFRHTSVSEPETDHI